jgi:hypothetical protein
LRLAQKKAINWFAATYPKGYPVTSFLMTHF